MVERLDMGLGRLARCFERDLGRRVSDTPGAGAAGGMGAAVLAFFGGELISGIDYILEAIGFDSALKDADLLITGEGSFDSQSLGGKVISGLLARAGASGTPVDVVCGRAAGLERIDRAAWPKALRRVWSGTDLGAAAGRMLDAEDLSRLTALAVSDFMSRREKKNEG